MIKIRLHGTSEEIENAINHFRADPAIRILMESDPYKDRRNSEYYRCYVEAEINNRSTKNEEIH